MKKTIKAAEILAPAGSIEKLKTAVRYGANAVYLGGEDFSLRKAGNNFSENTLKEAVLWAHKNGCKVYTTVNIFPREHELDKIADFLQFLESISVDAVIVADLGVFEIAREKAPNTPVHISTQANVTNSRAAAFWERMGAERVVLARECSLEEIRKIKSKTSIDIEVFVHGAMCISYSGRCLMSLVMTGRDANRGNCSHPCRWKYHLTEEKRPNTFFPVTEDERGTYFFNSRDLCLIEELSLLIETGVSIFKIEGRTKGDYYVGATTRVYRAAVEAITQGKYSEKLNRFLVNELETVNNRGYCKGFLFGVPKLEGSDLESTKLDTNCQIVGLVKDVRNCEFCIKTKSGFFINDSLTVLCQGDGTSKISNHKGKVDIIRAQNGKSLSFALPNEEVWVTVSGYQPVPGDIVRKEI